MSLAEKVPQALQVKIDEIIDNVKPSPWLNETKKMIILQR